MASEEQFDSVEANLAVTTATIRRVADLQDRLEANLDRLIRAITAEHSNGKKGQ